MNNFIASYEKYSKLYKKIECKMNFLNQRRKPKLSDIKLISVGLIYDNQVFVTLSPTLLCKIEYSVYINNRNINNLKISIA